jgi:NIPSNAP
VRRRTLLQLLPAAAFLPAILGAAAQGETTMPDSNEVFELRVYHAAEGKLPDLLARFRDHTDKLFAKHGLKSVAYWTPLDDPDKGKTLIYILRHPSREAAAKNWKSFQDDAEWKSVKAKSEENGPLTTKVDSTYMVLTDFSKKLQ